MRDWSTFDWFGALIAALLVFLLLASVVDAGVDAVRRMRRERGDKDRRA